MHSRVSLFGVTVDSEIPLPAPLASADPADVTIRFGRVPHTLEGARISRPRSEADDRSVLLRVDRVGRFLVRDAREVIVDPDPGAETPWIVHVLLSGVMAVVLQGRGVLTLHASAVRVGDAAVVFAGASGTGKSTLAAYLARCGHVVQSDGFVAIVDTRGAPAVLAGPATQKLWPDAAEWLGLDPMHPRLAPATRKFLIAEAHTPARESVPLARIYVLDPTYTESSGRSRGNRRFTDLAGHLFMPHVVWGKTGDQAARLLELARSSRVERLARAPGPLDTSLPLMGKAVLDALSLV
jgi:hypothetical protein